MKLKYIEYICLMKQYVVCSLLTGGSFSLMIRALRGSWHNCCWPFSPHPCLAIKVSESAVFNEREAVSNSGQKIRKRGKQPGRWKSPECGKLSKKCGQFLSASSSYSRSLIGDYCEKNSYSQFLFGKQLHIHRFFFLLDGESTVNKSQILL